MGLGLAAAIEVRRTEQFVLPSRIGVLQNCALKPFHGRREVAGFKMRRTGADECVELQRIIWSQTERDGQPLEGSFGMPLANLDQPTAGPSPRGTPANGRALRAAKSAISISFSKANVLPRIARIVASREDDNGEVSPSRRAWLLHRTGTKARRRPPQHRDEFGSEFRQSAQSAPYRHVHY